jgi:hypothetical protein
MWGGAHKEEDEPAGRRRAREGEPDTGGELLELARRALPSKPTQPSTLGPRCRRGMRRRKEGGESF